jgi:cytochrome c-type biogenesis protein CcmH/NrfG
VHAKWAFLLLALVFGLGFVFLGIGSGSNGITDALQNAFNFGKSSGGASISSLEHKTQKNPLDAKAWRDLATAYETKQRTNDAIIALSQYTGLRPKDTDALAELASEYGQQANQYAQDYQATQQTASVLTPPFAAFPPAASSPFGKALTDPKALQDPISASLRAQAQAAQQTALSNYQTAQSNAEQTYQKLAKLTPKDPNAQYQLAQSADAAGDSKVAIAAYKAVIKLVPAKTDPLRTDAEQRLKALTPATKK